MPGVEIRDTVPEQTPPADPFHPGEPAARVRLPDVACAKVTCVSDKSKAPAKSEKGSRRRRVAVLALIILGALCIFISTLSVWIRDVALDEDVWPETSSQLLQSENIRKSLSIYLVDQAYASSDAEVRLQEALPEQLKPLQARSRPSSKESPTTLSTGRSSGRASRSSGALRTGRSTPSSSPS